MKTITIAIALATVSTPALAGKTHHSKSKHVRHHHARAAVMDAQPGQGAYSAMVERHAAANGVPASLVHRVIMRESRYNSRAVSKGNYGIMQIRLGTARAMGYTGSAAGLLDPEVNMTYAVRYLAGAYRAAAGNPTRAVGYYPSGYSHQAHGAGLSAHAMEGPAVAGYGADRTSEPVGMPAAVGPFRAQVF